MKPGGSFKGANLPVYRTIRVHSHGNVDKLLDCVDEVIDEWDFGQIVFSHGTSPFVENDVRLKDKACSARAAFKMAWENGLTPKPNV